MMRMIFYGQICIYYFQPLLDLQQQKTTMQEQQQNQPPPPPPQNQPIYTPIIFILTETIGQNQSTATNKSTEQMLTSHVPAQYKYQDILVPVSVRNVELVYLYYVFHVPGVYNWLRGMRVVGGQVGGGGCFQRRELEQYVQGNIGTNNKNITQPKRLHSNKSPQSPNPQKFVKTLQALSSKYQILKKCLATKIYILKPSSTPCKHYLKLSVHSFDYFYEKEVESLGIRSFYCRECQEVVRVQEGQYVMEFVPFAPIFNQFYGQKISIKYEKNSLTTASTNKKHLPLRLNYKITQIYTEKSILIQAANALWYKSDYLVNLQQENGYTVGQFKVSGEIGKVFEEMKNKKWKGLCVYVREEMVSNCGVLRMAQRLLGDQTSEKIKKVQKRNINDKNTTQNQQIKFNRNEQKTKKQPKPTVTALHNINKTNQMQQELQQMTDEKYNTARNILIPQNLGSIGLKYRQEAQKLYLKPKQKDQYEKDYDKGKTKKIKKKVEYIKPDFNEIFKTVKKENQELIAGLRQPEKKNRRVFRKESKDHEGDVNKTNENGNKGGDNKDRKFNKFGKGGPKGKFGGGGKFGGRKQFKKWKKQSKERFVKRFEQS